MKCKKTKKIPCVPFFIFLTHLLTKKIVTNRKLIKDTKPLKKLKCFFSKRSKSSTKQQPSTMAATIMMPQQIDAAIKEMCADAMSQAVAALAEKYGFDAEEANRFLVTGDLKIVRKRGPSPKTTPASPKDTKSKAADKPKRVKTGYLLYGDEVRDEVRAELESNLKDGAKLKPQDVVRAIAARWKEEDQSVKDEWKAKAKTPVTSDDEVEADVEAEVEAKVEAKVEAESDTDSEGEEEETPPVAKKEKSKKSKKGSNE